MVAAVVGQAGGAARAAEPGGKLLVVAADNDELDCGDVCDNGGYSVWLGGPRSAFKRQFRMFSVRAPLLSPDQAWIAYTDDASPSGRVQIDVRPLAWSKRPRLGPPRVLLKAPVWRSDFAWSPDGRSLAVLAQEHGRPRLTIFNVVSGARRNVPIGCVHVVPSSSDYGAIAWSASGAIALAGGAGRAIYSVAANGRSPCRKLAAQAGSALAWSPGGDRLLFAAATGLFTVGAKGGDPLRLLSADADSAAWAPDGRSIAYLEPNKGAVRLYRLDTHGRVTFAPAIHLSEQPHAPSGLDRVTWLAAPPR